MGLEKTRGLEAELQRGVALCLMREACLKRWKLSEALMMRDTKTVRAWVQTTGWQEERLPKSVQSVDSYSVESSRGQRKQEEARQAGEPDARGLGTFIATT